ncbi:MAG: hypothetical protein WBF48_13995 [Halarcobacter sp.]
MKAIILFVFILSLTLFASEKVAGKSIEKQNDEKKKIRIEKQIKIEMEREKEYARKQSFYIDLEGAKVNEESLKDVPVLEIDDFDMDSTYD